jgi:hypothetical protein
MKMYEKKVSITIFGPSIEEVRVPIHGEDYGR